ncbi:MAG: tRNA preQ1(34) S-adenosylmethionine ribosyltransferase-isomerase QueA [Pseudomonadota bacterium]
MHNTFTPPAQEPEDLLLSSYVYDLPEERIAQYPAAVRGQSRLMVINRAEGTREHGHFSDICEHLPKGALLIVNNSKVLPARLLGHRASGGKVEFLMLTPLPLVAQSELELDTTPFPVSLLPSDASGASAFSGASASPALQWRMAEVEGLLKASKALRSGEILDFGPKLKLEVIHKGDFGRSRVKLFWQGDLGERFATQGHLPLPPYIRREDATADHDRYQTVFAREDKLGSVAAPTAGLHFTPEIRQKLAEHGIEWAEVTLYVGYGTFSPVRCDHILDHEMHAEYVTLSHETVDAIEKAKAEGRPVVAVGTTSSRVLEGVATTLGSLQPYTGWINIFMYPGYTFKVVDQLITNFHLPESSLLMLVSAFAGRINMLTAYKEAVAMEYRFFSYGDAMLLK